MSTQVKSMNRSQYKDLCEKKHGGKLSSTAFSKMKKPDVIALLDKITNNIDKSKSKLTFPQFEKQMLKTLVSAPLSSSEKTAQIKSAWDEQVCIAPTTRPLLATIPHV
jgi:Fe-S cluster assembly scaffold protein SufB